jgi:hypothetical protein
MSASNEPTRRRRGWNIALSERQDSGLRLPSAAMLQTRSGTNGSTTQFD